MKKFSILFMTALAFFSVQAQQQQRMSATSAVTISVGGNTNAIVSVDGTAYTGTMASDRSTIAINSLSAGPHTLLVTGSNRSELINTTFNLRNRYDMMVKLNADGSLELIETKRAGYNGNQSRMNAAQFNKLWNNVRSQRSVETRRSIIATAFSTAANSSTTSGRYYSSAQISQLLQLVTNESYRLQLAKSGYAVVADPVNYTQVYNLFGTNSKADLQNYVDRYNDGTYDPTTTTTTTTTYPAMSDANFNSLYQTIRQQWPTSVQLTSLTNAFNNTSNYFSTYQARQLIQLTTSEYNRLQLAKMSYRNITDPENFSQMGNVFNTQASRDELTVYVNNYRSGNTNTGSTNIHVAMSDVNFSALMRTLNYQFLPGEQMNSLIGIFNNSSNYFTSGQVKQLIELVSLEGNRLQLAKLAYRSLVDRNNYTQLYDLFNTQASKSELDAYAYAYRD